MEMLIYTGLKIVIVGTAVGLLPTLVALALGKSNDTKLLLKVAVASVIPCVILMAVGLGFVEYGTWALTHLPH